MEFSEKAAARSKFRSTQHLKRVHGGRGRGRGHQPVLDTHQPELESNYDRYELSEEEDAAEGEVVRQSDGADLGQLLAESEHFYAQAHFRYRSFIETVDTEPPPVDVSAVEQELALEPDLLMQALAQLPLSELLGIQPQFLVGLEDQLPAPAAAQQATQQQQEQQQQQQQTAALPAQQQRGAVVQQQPVAADQQRRQSNSNSSNFSGTLTAQRPPTATTITDKAVVNEDDDVLQQLLEGSSSSGPSSTKTLSSSSGTPSAGVSAQGVPAKNNTSSPLPASTQPQQQANVGRPSAVPAVPGQAPRGAAGTGGGRKAAAAGEDSLDELLGISKSASKAQMAVQHTNINNSSTPAGAPSRSGIKKQSLEDWLEGF